MTNCAVGFVLRCLQGASMSQNFTRRVWTTRTTHTRYAVPQAWHTDKGRVISRTKLGWSFQRESRQTGGSAKRVAQRNCRIFQISHTAAMYPTDNLHRELEISPTSPAAGLRP